MIGAICGDVCGSIYEFHNKKTKNITLFDEKCRFTDDSVMTIAIFKALQECNGNYENLTLKAIENMREFGQKYLHVGYGEKFKNWIMCENPQPYNSWGNGSAMRISPVAYFCKSLEEVKKLSKMVTETTHNHPEGLKGAEAVAVCIWLAINGESKETIKNYIEKNYYSLNFDYEDLRKNYTFKVSCQNSVPQAIYCFLLSKDFEDCLRTSISIGGDSDTISAISCSIAEAYYGLPKQFEEKTQNFLDDDLKPIAKEMISLRNKTMEKLKWQKKQS